MNVPIVRLTSLAHGGGCGCKLAPSVLKELLADQPAAQPYRELLVGTETGDDAAVWQLDDETCIIATTDFFMPTPGRRQSRLGPERFRSGLATFSKSAATCVRWAGLAPTRTREPRTE